jgi:hypothetical protein
MARPRHLPRRSETARLRVAGASRVPDFVGQARTAGAQPAPGAFGRTPGAGGWTLLVEPPLPDAPEGPGASLDPAGEDSDGVDGATEGGLDGDGGDPGGAGGTRRASRTSLLRVVGGGADRPRPGAF